MRVAYLTGHLPFPPTSGGRRRDAELLSRLAALADIHLFTVSKTYQDDSANAAAVEGAASVSVFEATPHAAPQEAPSKVRSHWSARVAPAILARHRREPFDVVHVEGYFLVHHLVTGLDVPVSLVAENVEFEVERAAEAILGHAEEPSWRVTRVAEVAAWRLAIICGAVSEDDAATMRSIVPDLDVRHIPQGSDHRALVGAPTVPDNGRGDTPTVVYLANFGYGPSADGASFLVSAIWPHIVAAIPTARLLLIGVNHDPSLLNAARREPSIQTVGPMEPALAFSRGDVMLAPLRFGGGVKTKILEAVYYAFPTVTTPVGTQGLPVVVREGLIVAHTAEDLAASTIALLSSRRAREEVSAQLAHAAASLPSWNQAAENLLDCWRDAARLKVPAGRTGRARNSRNR